MTASQEFCRFPDCKCPMDPGPAVDWCARGLPHRRARLAQPEAEPVMGFYATAHNGVPEVGWSWLVDPTTLPAGTRLYTASQPAVPSATATAERALDNCRRYAAQHRNELWAQGILRLCADAGCVASPLRATPQPAVHTESGKTAEELWLETGRLRAILADKAKPEAGPVEAGSVSHLKLMMEASAWEGRLELSDALANIDEFYTTPQPAVPESVETEMTTACVRCHGRGWVVRAPKGDKP